MSAALPVLVCPRRDFAALGTDWWKGMPSVELSDAVTGASPVQRASVRTAWSATEWRVFFDCMDTEPWATMTERDAPLFEEETVEIFFDPIGDLEGYYEIEVNPLCAILDIVFRRSRSGYKGDWAWDCAGLRAAAQMREGGWQVELAIPFASVGTVPKEGSRWRVNFCRIDRPGLEGARTRELTAWVPPLRENFHTPERFGFVEFRA